MNTKPIKIKRALISLSDKENLVKLAKTLIKHNVEILSTGGTGKALSDAGIKYTSVEQYTQAKEMMDGRVKTLHPKIAGAILGLRDKHAPDAQEHDIIWIDLVVCNLYPFKETIEKKGVTEEQIVEQIDIGGPTLIRSAAKNFGWTAVVTDKEDYDVVIEQLENSGSISFDLRKTLAIKAFEHTAAYDSLIARYFNESTFPKELSLSFNLFTDPLYKSNTLRYGENPHQQGAVYKGFTYGGKTDPFSLLDAKLLQGKQLSFNNLGDTYGAIDTLREFETTACVIVKHATPCGVALANSSYEALIKAFEADSLSAFGGIIALNGELDEKCATYLSDKFIEVVTAASFSSEALKILAKKKNLRVLETGKLPQLTNHLVGRFIGNDLLIQNKDGHTLDKSKLECVTSRKPDESELEDLLFAWKVVKHVKSNAIVTAKDKVTLGIGGGQVSRVDATNIALQKSKKQSNIVLASDAFFPFADSIELAKKANVSAIIQPGGSIRDDEVIKACNEANIAMLFTSIRSFYHG